MRSSSRCSPYASSAGEVNLKTSAPRWGGNGNRETVARVVSEQRILKTGDQASVANGKFQGLTLSGRIEYLSVGKSPCIVHANGIAVFDCHERLLNVV